MFHEVVDDARDDGSAEESDDGSAEESDDGSAEAPDDGSAEGSDNEVTAAALLASFETLLRESAHEIGRDGIVEEAGLSEDDAEAAVDGDVADLTVADGAAVLALTADYDADAVVAELRDHLLIGMATAVLDVDTIAAAIDADLTGQEVQQALEGRTAMTLGQLAEIMAVIERRKR